MLSLGRARATSVEVKNCFLLLDTQQIKKFDIEKAAKLFKNSKH